jgi:hypothetical protein
LASYSLLMSVVLCKMPYILVQHHVKIVISGVLSLVLESYGSKVLQKSLIFTTSTKRQSLTPEQLNSHSAGGAASSVQHYGNMLPRTAVLSLMAPQSCQHTGISMSNLP